MLMFGRNVPMPDYSKLYLKHEWHPLFCPYTPGSSEGFYCWVLEAPLYISPVGENFFLWTQVWRVCRAYPVTFDRGYFAGCYYAIIDGKLFLIGGEFDDC